MYELIKKVKNINKMVEENKEITIIANLDDDGNTQKITNKKHTSILKDIDTFTYGRCFRTIGNSKSTGKIELLTKFADENFCVKDMKTGEFYMSVSEELGEKVKKITILKSSENSSEFYSYLTKNGQNDLIRVAISDNKENKKIVVTNTQSNKLQNIELLEYVDEIGLGDLLENILANNIENVKNMFNNFQNNEDEIKAQANESYEQYISREGKFYSEIPSDEEVQMQMEEYLKRYRVTLNGQELDAEKSTLEIGNAMTAVDEEEVQRPEMWNLCFYLNNSMKLQIARTQGITFPLNNSLNAKEL